MWWPRIVVHDIVNAVFTMQPLRMHTGVKSRGIFPLESSAAADSNAAGVELLATGLELKSSEINRGLALRDGPEVAGDRRSSPVDQL